MEWVEITSRTIQEATEEALDSLGVDEADAEIEILEEPQAGLFGRTKGKARVRARVLPKEQPRKQERRERRRSPKGRSNGDESPKRDSESGQSKDSAPAVAPRPKATPRPREREESPRSDEPTMGFEEHIETVEKFVRGLVAAFGLTAEIKIVELDEETREIQVNGDDLGLLIGPRGNTLQAIHDVARTVVFRAAPGGQAGRVRIDIGSYRERRREALARFAELVAQEVIASGTAKALEPMSPPDRKVVHDTITDIAGAVTSSEGQEPRRRVVVSPA